MIRLLRLPGISPRTAKSSLRFQRQSGIGPDGHGSGWELNPSRSFSANNQKRHAAPKGGYAR